MIADVAAAVPAVPDAGSAAPGVLASYSSGRDPGLFNLEIDFQGSWPAELQQAFLHAAQVIESIIAADLPDIVVPDASGAARVDDLVISAALETIDGAGGTLGRAAPVALRAPFGLPLLGSMTFDIADAWALESAAPAVPGSGAGQATPWDATVLHEMLHVLGVGTLWAMKGLVAGDAYVGAAGTLAYAQLLDPAATAGLPVPLQAEGGPGTAGVHWSEAVFGAELMTGYLNAADPPLSPLTVASLADLGYGLDPAGMSRLDPYMLA